MRFFGALILATTLLQGPVFAQDGPPVPEKRIHFTQNIDLPGGDISQMLDSSLDACVRACLKSTSCTALTFNSRNNACFGKANPDAGMPFLGALSGQVVTRDTTQTRRAVLRQDELLVFLSAQDLTQAQSQAWKLPQTFPGENQPLDELRIRAQQAEDASDLQTALRLTAILVGQTDTPDDWLAYSRRASLLSNQSDQDSNALIQTAVQAAMNAYLRSDDNPSTRHDILRQVAIALEQSDRGRDTVKALRLAQALEPNPATEALLDEAIGKYGFRIVNHEVQADSLRPRICADFSEDLMKGGIDYEDYARLPSPGLTVSLSGSRQLCVEGMEHGARYSVTFRAGLPALDGQRLSKDVELSSYIRDRSPMVRFPGRAYLLPSAGEAALPVLTTNTESLDLTLFRISDRSLLRALQKDYLRDPIEAWQEQDFTEDMGSKVWSGKATVGASGDAQVNKDVTTRLPMTEALAGQKPGIYALKAALPDVDPYENTPAWQWFVVSDLGLTSLSGTDGLHIFVRSLATTDAKVGAKVELISKGNEVLATAETNAMGYARFPADLLRGIGAATPALVVAREGEEDLSFLSLTDPEFDLSDRGVEGREAAPPIDLFLTTERGAYRAGETVHVTALARDSSAAAVQGLPLTARLKRPDGVEYSRALVNDSGAGGYVFDLPIGATAPRGVWRLEVFADLEAAALASKTFLVEDFLPERIDFKIENSTAALSITGPVEVDVSAQYLFGAPAADLVIEGEVVLRAAKEMAGYAGYHFGPHDQPFSAQVESFSGERSDAEGKAHLALNLPHTEEPQQPIEARVVMRLAEGSGRPVERDLIVPIKPKAPLIGIKPLFQEVAAQGQDAGFSLISVANDDQPLAAQWSLTRVETQYQWYQNSGNWNWEPVTTRSPVASGKVDIGASPQQIAAMVDWGQYELSVASEDGRALSSITFAAGWYAPADVTATPDTLVLSLDKPNYHAGETAELRIVPRAAGTALISILSNRLISMQAVKVNEGENLISLPVTDDWGAGVYVTASVLRPMEVAAGRNPSRTLGLAHAAIAPGARQLTATIEAPTEAAPRGPIDVALKVEGLAAGDQAWATIAAVDQGILNLTGFTAPDPSGYYFGQRKLGVGIRDVYGRLIDSMSGVAGQVRSGGDAGAQARLQAPPPTEELVAFFSGPISVDDQGYARTRFDLPAFNGSVKIMAIAWSTKAVGQASADVLVRDPVVLTASLPRFMAPGDESRTLLEFHHTSGPAGEMTMSATAAGLSLGALPERFTLSEGGQAKFVLPVTAGDLGLQQIQITLTTPDGKDLVKTLQLPVQINDPQVSHTTRIDLAKGQTLNLDQSLFADLTPESASATLAIGPFGRIDAPGLLAMLDAYPYGCTEQITSKALPLLYHDQVAQALGLSGESGLRDRLQQAVAKVLTNQSAEGSFGLWSPGSGDMWLDAYVTDFLSRAKAQGLSVPEQALRQALDNLRNQVNYASDFDQDSNERSAALAYAMMVLARESAAAIGDLRYYADVKADAFATPLAQAQLGLALASYGDQPRADAMFRKAGASLAKADKDQAQIYRTDYGTTYRDRAAVLALSLEAGSNALDPNDLLTGLSNPPARLSTQEASWALLASHALIEKSATIGIQINGAPVTGPLVKVLQPGQGPIAIHNTGADTQLTLTTLGTPVVPGPAEGNGYAISRTYYDMQGQAASLEGLKIGDRLVVVLEVTPFADSGARLMVADPLPAGFEIDNPNLLAGGDIGTLDWLDLKNDVAHSEFRQDRFITALDQRDASPFRLAYIVRAISPGSFHHPAASVEDMYRPTFRAQTESGRIEIAP